MTPFPPQGPYGGQMQPAPRPKKGMSGCLVALLVVGGVAVVGAVAAAVGVYLFATSSTGRAAFKLIGDGSKMAQKAMTAPGTPELRKLGCDQAMVFDVRDMSALIADFVDAGPDADVPEGLMVMCQVRRFSRAPSCNDVASTYVKAVKTPSSAFAVIVQREGKNDSECESSYDASGAFVGTGTGALTMPGSSSPP